MTTTETFPFSAQEPQAPAGPPEVDGDPSRRPSRRTLMAGAGVLALAVAGGAFLLLSGGGGTDQQGLVAHGKPPAASSSAGPAGAGTTTRKKLPVYRGAPAGRDPFKPLVTPPPPAAPPSQAAPVPSVTSVPIVGPGAGETTGTGTGGGTPQPTPSASHPAPATILVFKGISFTSGNVPMVDITFAGKSYRLKSGGKVDNVLRVVSIQPDDSMAVFQVGDQTFDLHVGQAWVG